jgi:NADPH-dependent glutamate synthase beta subunit-like oxidoreductase
MVRDFQQSIIQVFVPNTNVGVDVDNDTIRAEHDAIVICTGATWPRDLKIPNRQVDGIHFAMEFLQVSEKRQSFISSLNAFSF